MFTAFPKNRDPGDVTSASILPFFSAAAAARQPVSAGMNLSANVADAGFASGQYVVRGSGLFVASTGIASANVATSPDGRDNWVLRAMPSSQIWRVGANGSNHVAFDAGGSATARSSDDGITWVAGATASAFHADVENIPVENGGVWLANRTTISTANRSVDNGATWVSQTLPAQNGMDFFLKVAGLYWYWSSGTTAYSSPTGLTGSWTSRTLPVTPHPTIIWSNPGEDAVYIAPAGGAFVYKTVDGINWVDTELPLFITNTPNFLIEGVFVSFGATTDPSFAKHGDYLNQYWSSMGAVANNRLATDGARTYLVPYGFGINRITDDNIFGVFR